MSWWCRNYPALAKMLVPECKQGHVYLILPVNPASAEPPALLHTLQTLFEQTHVGNTPKTDDIHWERLQCHCYSNDFCFPSHSLHLLTDTDSLSCAYTSSDMLKSTPHNQRQAHDCTNTHSAQTYINYLTFFSFLVSTDTTNSLHVFFLLNWRLNPEAWSSQQFHHQ